MPKQAYNLTGALVALLGLCWAGTASAQLFDPPDHPWKIRTTAIGLFFDADSDNLNLDIDNTADLAIDVSYYFNPNLAVQVLATYDSVEVKSPACGTLLATAAGGTNSCGSVNLLPPIFTLQYHLVQSAHQNIDPYVGVGFNYNHFDSESGKLSDAEVDIDDTIGFAAEAGVDIDLTPRFFVNATYKYLNLSPDVDVGTPAAPDDELDIDAHIVGIGVGYRL